jgi:hypothetical protein
MQLAGTLLGLCRKPLHSLMILLSAAVLAVGLVVTFSGRAFAGDGPIFYFNGTGVAHYPCGNGTYRDPPEMNQVHNNCAERVWIHQYDDGGGWAKCLDPSAIFGPWHQAYWHPGNVQVTTVDQACPSGSHP